MIRTARFRFALDLALVAILSLPVSFALAEQPTQARASADNLHSIATSAVSLIRAHQKPAGYWLTSYTSEPHFEKPTLEMNTFLTSMLVDMISPIAHAQGLDDVWARAREHLRTQIEDNGLVRFHGLPNGPTIGPLGCVITPDADDTALVWRIARRALAPNDPRRQTMLETLGRYRDARGLYRTWLAPRDKYECLDPGHDPDPADATINMHVYMMLREVDPPKASDLCRALESTIADENVWVYYARAPLVPFWRCAELRKLGCALPMPDDRLAHPAAGQEVWSEMMRRLVATLDSPPRANDRTAILDLLNRTSREDFAEIHRNPPLLYHNDLTATVPRYYWSEDFGYALWLRLYDAAAKAY